MNKTIDTVYLRCPEPLMIVRRTMRTLESGDTLTVTADDPSTERDFTLLCTHMNYTLLSHTVDGSIHTFVIEK